MDVVGAVDEALGSRKVRVHFVGVGGSGVGALAEHRALWGGRASGSDRSFDRGVDSRAAERLRAVGVAIAPQDGSGVRGADLVVASSAVEEGVPDLAEARARGIPIASRAQCLARMGRLGPSVAVAGSAGKTTTTAMLYRILEAAGREPSLVLGGALLSLRSAVRPGHAAVGSGPLVYEADESDGSLVLHEPEVGIVLNLHHDHMDVTDLVEQFLTFARRCRRLCLVGSDPGLDVVAAGARQALRLPDERMAPAAGRGWSMTMRFEGADVSVPLPSGPNAENARAALFCAKTLGLSPAEAARGLASFEGVARRFERVGEGGGVLVVDDFAHNPAKLAASIRLGQQVARHVWAWWQPHGFAPTRRLFHDLVEAFAASLGSSASLWIAPIYYAGGTVSRDVSSEDLVAACRKRGLPVELASRRADFVRAVVEQACPGDMALVLGARDPTIPELAREILDALRRRVR